MEKTLNFALKMPYLAIFRLELEKTIVMLDFTTFNLSKCIFLAKKIFLNLGLNFLGLELEKLLYYNILHQHPQICPNTKFRPKIKILKLRTKIALILYFGLEFQKANVVFEISILAFVNMQCLIQKQTKVL